MLQLTKREKFWAARCLDLVGAIGFEPTTPCAQGVIPRCLPIAAVVSRLFGMRCLCGLASILASADFTQFLARVPTVFTTACYRRERAFEVFWSGCI
jgi:hypothetical protein